MPKDKKDKKEKKERKEKKDKTTAVVIEEPVASTSSATAAAALDEPSSSSSSSSRPDEPMSLVNAAPTASSDADDAVDNTSAIAPAEPVEGGPSKVQVDDGTLLEIDPDAPAPLSRAALRKAKAGGGSAATDASSSTTTATTAAAGEKGKGKAAEGAAAKPGKYSVWVGNLAFKTTEGELRDYFRPALTLGGGSSGKGKSKATPDDDDDNDDDESAASASESEGEEGAAAGETKEKKARPEPTITRVNMPRSKAVGGRPGVNKGFAYVDFSNWASQQAAVKLSEGHLHGRALLIKAGSDFSNRPEAPKAALASLPEGQTKSKTAQALLAKQRNPVGCTLFVGNLGFEATEEAMRELIEAHWTTSLANNKRHAQKAAKSNFLPESESTGAGGEDGAPAAAGEEASGEGKKEGGAESSAETLVGFAAGLRKVRMAQFQDSGKCKGFAFLDFFTPAQATAALVDMRNHRLDGRSLKMEYASPSAAARSGTGSHSFNAPIASSSFDPSAPGADEPSAKPGPTPRTTRKIRPMKAERAAAKLAAAVAAGTATADEVASHEKAVAAAAEHASSGGAPGDRKRSAPNEGGERRAGRPAKLAKWEQSGRQAPGAALAMAKRENVGIVESQGKKVVFD